MFVARLPWNPRALRTVELCARASPASRLVVRVRGSLGVDADRPPCNGQLRTGTDQGNPTV